MLKTIRLLDKPVSKKINKNNKAIRFGVDKNIDRLLN